VNNTEKLDDIRRRLQVIDTRLAVIQRASVVMFERITGGGFPPHWLVHDAERAILADSEAADGDFWSAVTSEFGPK
jgi:hypothetical protein